MKLLFLTVICVAIYMVSGECPEGICAEDQTCCDGPAPDVYGCCPQKNAVCCSDKIHCCPQNTVCNLEKSRCDDKDGYIHPFLVKVPPTPELKSAPVQPANSLRVVYCPGGFSYCPDGNTCCPTRTGQYTCCPYPFASCCADYIHCCPYGTRCDATGQYCLHAEGRYEAMMKRPALPMK